MKMTKYVFIALLSFQGVKANPNSGNSELKCFQQQKLVFAVKMLSPSIHSVTPYDDALLIFNQAQPKALPMNLTEVKKGSLSSQKTFAIHGGGQLVLSESLITGLGCGRRLCDPLDEGNKKVSANLIANNGQSYVYDCVKNN